MNSFTRVLSHIIEVPSAKLNSVDDYLLQTLKDGVEGYCTSDGYIVSILEIISKSSPIVNVNNFEGKVNINIYYKAEVAKYKIGDTVIGCKVKNVANLGVFLEKNDFILIFIPKENYTQEVTEFKENDVYNVQILQVKMGIGQKGIEIIGKISYYSEIKEYNRILSFPEHSGDFPELSPELTNIKSIIKNECELGYNQNIEILLPQVAELPKSISEYYFEIMEMINLPKEYQVFEILQKFNIQSFKTAFTNDKKIESIIKKVNSKVSIKSGADLVVLNDTLDFSKEKLSEILKCLGKLNKDGTFIVSMYDCCTELSVNIIYLLYILFKKVIIYKPEVNCQYTNEKFIICQGYQEMNKKIMGDLEKIVKTDENYIKRLFIIKNSDFRVLLKTYNEVTFNIYVQRLYEMLMFVGYNAEGKLSNDEFELRKKLQKKNNDDWKKKYNY